MVQPRAVVSTFISSHAKKAIQGGNRRCFRAFFDWLPTVNATGVTRGQYELRLAGLNSSEIGGIESRGADGLKRYWIIVWSRVAGPASGSFSPCLPRGA